MKNRIREHRQAQGMTAAALAKKVGTSPPQISRLENGEREVTLKWITRLSRALNIPADELVDLPFDKSFTVKCDQALLGSVIGWLMEACDKYKIKPTAKALSKWASYAYNEVVESHLNFKQTKELAFNLVKAGKVK